MPNRRGVSTNPYVRLELYGRILLNYIHCINTHLIEKDSLRTDRHIDHFDGEEGDKNIESLKRILGCFVLHDPELGTYAELGTFTIHAHIISAVIMFIYESICKI